MTDDGNKLLHHRTEFDDWRSLTIGIYMALVGYAVMVGLPVISTSWVNNLGFSAVEVGRVAGADLGGLAIGAVISALYVARVDRRYLAVGAALIAIAANALCIFYQSYEATVWLRLAAGIGSGIYTGIAVATIAGHSKPAFAFGLELFAFAGSQGAELKLLPFLSIEWRLCSAYRHLRRRPLIHILATQTSGRQGAGCRDRCRGVRRSTSHRAQTRASLRAMDGTDSDRPYVYQHRRVLDLH